MDFPIHGNHFSKDFVLEKISQIGRDFGMIASRKRLRKSLKEESRDIVKRTWPLSTRQGREKERVIVRRVTVMEDHHS
jgi:hypothetical protein